MTFHALTDVISFDSSFTCPVAFLVIYEKPLDIALIPTPIYGNFPRALKAIPGVATKLTSRLIGENRNIHRFPSEKQLAVYCGMACVDNNSDKISKAKAAYKANKICKQILITMAGGSIRLSLPPVKKR